MFLSEYITPLTGKPYYRSVGIIKAYDKYNRNYSVGEIILERFDEQNYQYIIKPYWELIEYIPHNAFQGIPGINMELRKTCYYRVNTIPTFITMRTPSESRENVKELMRSVGLDYYDRFEWLLRSESRCGDDNLYVIRKPFENKIISDLSKINIKNLHFGDIIEIESLCAFQSSNAKLIEDMFMLLQSGARIHLLDENRYIDNSERKIMLYLLKNMIEVLDQNNRVHREEGIKQAREKGKYKGRKPIEIDEQLLKLVALDFLSNRISEYEAMEKLGIKSRATFYRKIKSYRK